MQGGIHAGEIDGKDAGFLALRQMLDGTAAPEPSTRDAAVRPRVQRRRPRAIRSLESSEPDRTRGDGLADHGAEP
jgi:hypothetical protein